MCRLLLKTNKVALDAGMGVMLFETLLMRSLGDDNQAFGTGVSDGRQVYKSGRSALSLPLVTWIQDLDVKETWFAHLRKPSRGVESASTRAAHPFLFKDTGLIGAHNGFVANVLPDVEGDDPYVDSFYALKRLNDELVKGTPLSASLVNAWIEQFGPGSEFTMMLMYKHSAYIVRGVRPMYYIDLNGGRIYATSLPAILSTIEVTEALWPTYFKWGKKVHEVYDHTLVHIDPYGNISNANISARVPATIDPCAESYHAKV